VTRTLWEDVRLDPGNQDQVWELFHENSKIGKYQLPVSDQEVAARMALLWEVLPYEGYPVLELPRSLTPLSLSLAEAITSRVSARRLSPCSLTLANVATLLHYAYGITRDNQGTHFPRPFRVVPSAGALYPLEIFFHSACIQDAPAGLYHYNPLQHHLRRLRQGDESARIAAALAQPNLAGDASLLLFITALFERTTFKYGDRGYRFALLEAGHLTQNVNLVAAGLGLGSVNIGGFFDRQIDEFLDLDGLTHSTIYLVGIGKNLDNDPVALVNDAQG